MLVRIFICLFVAASCNSNKEVDVNSEREKVWKDKIEAKGIKEATREVVEESSHIIEKSGKVMELSSLVMQLEDKIKENCKITREELNRFAADLKTIMEEEPAGASVEKLNLKYDPQRDGCVGEMLINISKLGVKKEFKLPLPPPNILRDELMLEKL